MTSIWRYFDARGRRVISDLDERVIGLTLDEINKKVQLVVGVAGGAAKYEAIQAALEVDLVHVLVTDHVTAQRLLKAREKTIRRRLLPPLMPRDDTRESKDHCRARHSRHEGA